ncbi:MAG: nuclear transport factor 2 family protein [Acidobacteria bacterium]|nr:nuclear transport factor 2 family protein [Acidobacteriota bacterium]
MVKITAIIFAVFALSFSSYGQRAGGSTPDPAKQVREAFDRLIEGIRQVDAEKVMSSYEKSDRLLIFNNNGTATIGWENVRSNVESSYAKITNVTLEVTGVRVEMLGKNFAYVSCKWTQQQENDGKPESAAGRMTLVYKLVGKEWKVTHRHTSPDRPDPSRPVFPSEREN